MEEHEMMNVTLEMHACPCCNRVIGGKEGYCAKYRSRRHKGKWPWWSMLALTLTGCAHQRGLHNDAVKRTSTGWYTYLEASADMVNRRCTNRKSAWKICKDNPNRSECQNVPAEWDSGEVRGADASLSSRCCVVLRPTKADDRLRYWIWFSDPRCLAHEHGHIEIFEQDGFKYVPENHRRLHKFGLDKEKRTL